MKSFKKKDTKRFRKTRNKRRFNGGDEIIETPPQKTPDYRAKYIENDITNIEILAFLIQLLNMPDFKEKIIIKNQEYLNSITSENIGASFHYGENKKYRNFLNDVIQWFLLDYNQDFFNSILDVLLKCFENPIFLNEETDSFDILLFELNQKIDNKKLESSKIQDTNINNNITLLKLILEVLTTIPNLVIVVSDILKNQKIVLQNYSKSIICIITFLIKQDIKNNEKIRNLIKNYFSNLNLDIKGIITPALSLVGSCTTTVASNVIGNAMRSWWSPKPAPTTKLS
jgi:hypothetical protein